MRSGRPHTQDDRGRLPSDQRQAPFGPDTSWPTGYSDLEYRDGDYRYPAQQAQPPASHGEDPYAAYPAPGHRTDARGYGPPPAGDFGYGDPGYSDPRYNGPASQDAGIAGTRTVRGYVEPGYGQPGHAPLSAPTGPAPARGYGQPGHSAAGYSEPGYIELAYPLPQSNGDPGYREVETYRAADTYQQPWDYQQPLRYDGDERSREASGGYPPRGEYQPVNDWSGAYRTLPSGSADYNGSGYSRPGIDGPGYDLSGIIATGEFEAVGYDDPSYDRLAYDDPRYEDPSRYGDRRGASGAQRRFDETRFDMPRFDDTRLDSLWLANEDIRHDEPVGYGNDGFGTDAPARSGYSDPGTVGGADLAGRSAVAETRGHRFDETRFDMRPVDARMDHTRFDVPVYDETRIDNRRPLRPVADLRQAATDLLSNPDDWAELDTFSDFELDEPGSVPAAYVRTADRRSAREDTATRRAIGRRRGRSGDRRQWLALGAIAVVAAGAIGGVLMKYVFAGPSGPAHTVVAPNEVDGFTRMPSLEKAMKVSELRSEVMSSSSGQATDVVSAVYQQGSGAPGGNTQIFMFVGGKLSSAAPATSITNFTQAYQGATVVPAGSLGGQAACAEAQSNGEGVAMCVWFDNDSFGELVSPTMTTAKLATTLDAVRPSLEHYAR
jgi:hypothetical protein